MKPLLIQYSTNASQNKDPFTWQAAGMGYLIRSSKGRFIAIDGGFEVDAEGLTAMAEQYAEGKPQIVYWIITHPHRDHYGAPYQISKDEAIKNRLTVDYLLSCMPPRTFVDAGRGVPYEKDIGNVHAIAENLGIPDIHASRGEVYEVDDIKIEILLTYDDLESASDPNETSLIFRITAGGQTLLFLGDTYSAPARKLAALMGDTLKSDFCQLAHHALNGGADELYQLAKPTIALVPMARPAYYEMTEGRYADSNGTAANRHVLQTLPTENQWVSADGHRVVELPFPLPNA